MAQPGGVLTRAGHTEAGCDLARLAGLEPAAVLVEILNEDGTMARRPDLEVFAEQHGVKIGTIADLIRYRMQNEKTVERVADALMNTEFGPFRVLTYQDAVGRQVHFALVKGEIHATEPVTVRVHVQNLLSDLLALRLPDSGWPLRDTLHRVANEPAGVLVFLSRPEEPATLIRRMRGYQFGSSEPPRTADQSAELRTYGIGAQILLDIGVRQMRVLGAPRRLTGLSGFNLEVVEYVS